MDSLICAPRFDAATEVSHRFSHEIDSYARAKGWSVVYLEGEQANPEAVEFQLRLRPRLFAFFDHGGYDTLWGQRGSKEAPLITMKNAELLAGCVVDALACQSGRDLGPEAVQRGARAFIGYNEITFVVDSPDCMRVMNASKRALLEKKTAGEAYDEQRNAYLGETCPVSRAIGRVFGRGVLARLRRARDRLAGRRGVSVLTYEFYAWNCSHLVIWGDKSAKI